MPDPNTPKPGADTRRTAQGGPSAGRDEDPSFGTDDSPTGRRPDDDAPRGRGAHANGPGADSVMPAREFGAGGQLDDGPRNTPGDPAAQARSAKDDTGAAQGGPAQQAPSGK
jgi:hypothetical protein